MGSLEHNRGNISSLIGGNMLNFGMEAFFILFFINNATNLVISQIKFCDVITLVLYSSAMVFLQVPPRYLKTLKTRYNEYLLPFSLWFSGR